MAHLAKHFAKEYFDKGFNFWTFQDGHKTVWVFYYLDKNISITVDDS